MPLPLVPLAVGALLGSAVGKKKNGKQTAVSKYKTKTGKKVKAHIRRIK
jgi:hypothetical protein